MSNDLKRLTTEYIETEDRIRLSGELGPDAPVVIWLTQRLVYRLLPVLIKWLQEQVDKSPLLTKPQSAAQASAAGVKDFLHQAAQQSARNAVTHQPPVRPVGESPVWLATAIDIAPVANGMKLRFRGTQPDQEAHLAMPAQGLRQWLGMLYEGTRRAGWPQEVWPEWVRAAAPTTQVKQGAVH